MSEIEGTVEETVDSGASNEIVTTISDRPVSTRINMEEEPVDAESLKEKLGRIYGRVVMLPDKHSGEFADDEELDTAKDMDELESRDGKFSPGTRKKHGGRPADMEKQLDFSPFKKWLPDRMRD